MTMEQRRLELHDKLVEVLGSDHVYFQPPESLKLKYPAIVYSRDGIDNVDANNDIYYQKYMYMLTVIDKDPDSAIVERVSKLKYCSFDRHYTKDDLNHDVFTIFY